MTCKFKCRGQRRTWDDCVEWLTGFVLEHGRPPTEKESREAFRAWRKEQLGCKGCGKPIPKDATYCGDCYI